MGNTGLPHPSEQALRAYALGSLSDAAARSSRVHLKTCAECRQRVAAQPADGFLERLQAAQGQPATPVPPRPATNLTLAPELGPIKDKELPPELLAHADYQVLGELGRDGMMERFLQEIRVAARLSDANIVAAYAAHRFGDSLVLAMEYVQGEDLAQLVKRKGPLSVHRAASTHSRRPRDCSTPTSAAWCIATSSRAI